jgi:hypothetical protein
MRATIVALLLLSPLAHADDTAWPPVTQEAKPWTRWWWLGSGVDAANLTKQLEQFSKAGLGGVEICPIYGAKGYEARDLPFLSEAWTNAYAHTAKETARLGMGVDLTTGTGWPFGGPEVAEANASASLESVKAAVEGGKETSLALPKGRIEVLSAWPESGEPLDLSDKVKDGRLVWTPPEGKWRIHGLVSKHGIQKVKRSAPGGAGWVLDPFSTASMSAYLKGFDTALERAGVPEPRAHFHDSFEYYGAAWTDELFPRFQELRGYDLRSQLPAFHGEGDPDTGARVRADYRETMSDLHREYLAKWHDWAKARGSLTRNQAHGSPGNLLDHYAVADIPETEIFRQVSEDQIPMLQFASSAAHVTGKKLVSAETFTWLDEHFRVTPAKLKEAADFVWLGGVNHILFHGIPYSPEDAGWPGWLFYASTHMGPSGGLWKDMPAFNAYIARCQTMLQSGAPDTEYLVYFPMHDLWHDGAKGLPLFTVHNQDKWLQKSGAWNAAMELRKCGIPYDFISDRGLRSVRNPNGLFELDGRDHKFIIVPKVHHMPVATLKQLLDLAAAGGNVVFLGGLPTDVPGFGDLGERRKLLAGLTAPFKGRTDLMGHGKGNVWDVEAAQYFRSLRVGIGEPMAVKKLSFIRRKQVDGWSYFIVNGSGAAFDGPVRFAQTMMSAVMFDPWTGCSGVAKVMLDRNSPRGPKGTEFVGEIRLVLAPGESRILRTYSDRIATGPAWSDPEPAGEAVELNGTWQVSFGEGGPKLPSSYETTGLASWTTREGDAYRSFSGTAHYRLEFEWSDKSPALLDLGTVAYTARVKLNGTDLGTCWAPPHRLMTGNALKEGKNVLEVEVTNLAANRIADLDRRKVEWKAFHEINFVNIDYKPFDAAGWEPMESGLLGPVRIVRIAGRDKE